MKKVDASVYRQWGQASMAGVMLVGCVFVGLGIGLLLDKYLGMRPLLTLAFLILGIIAGFVNVYRILQDLLRKP